MSSEQFREQGIAAAKARQPDEARRLLQQALRLNPGDALAWLYLASVAKDTKERLVYLQKVLEIDPDNDLAQKAVRALGIAPEQLLQAKPGTSAPAAPPKPAPAPPPPKPAAVQPPSYLDDLDMGDDEEEPAAPNAMVEIPSYLQGLDDDLDDDAAAFDTADDAVFEDTDAAFEDFDADEDPFAERTTLETLQPSASLAMVNAMRRQLPMPPAIAQSAPGIPLPDVEYLRQVLAYIEPITQAYQKPPVESVEWVHKDRNRAGERD
ncbi:MAG: tetratricopeptide repeat protein, partial [Armatimonadetes bacterium]|nr:tetratricopeptide repeat protein [Anaerolineae bacterium]